MPILLCGECNGAGAIAFERGPVAENCTGCAGVGLIATDERTLVRDLQKMLSVGGAYRELLAQASPGADLRLLLRAVDTLQTRIEALEQQR
jgi:hypothetical protein